MPYSLHKISGSTYNLLNEETGQIKNVNILLSERLSRWS